MKKKLLRKIGVGFLMFTMTMGVVHAGTSGLENATPEELRKFRDSGVIGTQPGSPSGGNSFGGCNKDGTFCWSFTLPTPYPHHQPYYPLEVYGQEAKNIVERGHIVDRRYGWSGWHYLVKTGWQHWFQYKNKTFDCSVSRGLPKDYYCQEWTPGNHW